MSSEHEHKEHHASHHEHSGSKPKKSLSWEIIGIVLGLVLIAAVASTWAGFNAGQSAASSAVVADNAALSKSVESFINTNLLLDKTVSAKITDVNSKNGLYELTYNIIQDGKNVFAGSVFSDGKRLIIGQAFDLDKPIPQAQQQTEQQATVAPEKKEKASAELYIFSYCPAGTAALDAFAKAADVLKSVADVKVKFFSDMHGPQELQENKTQECIQVVDANKYWTYAQRYVAEVYPKCGPTADVACDKNESTKLMNSLGIDSKKVWDCVAAQGDSIYQSDTADAGALGLRYSPSVVVNGTYVANADRSPEGLKTLICDSFNSAPSVCSAALSTTAKAGTGSCS